MWKINVFERNEIDKIQYDHFKLLKNVPKNHTKIKQNTFEN